MDIKVGDEVRLFDVNRKLGDEGKPGTVVKVGRKLATIKDDSNGREQVFRLDTGHVNDGYGHQYLMTPEDVALAEVVKTWDQD